MQTLSADQLVGSALGGEYTVEQLLGRGALTAVYVGQQHSPSRRVLVTMFLIPERFSDAMRERFKARFLREAEALVGLRHPSILPVYDCGEHAGSPYLVTAYTKDQSLARIVKDQPRFTMQQTLKLLRQLADGLDYASSNGVVHGSLSPATILLSEQHTASMAGFGFVRMLAMQGIEDRSFPYAHLVNVANSFLGIPGYIAPESVQQPILDARSDVYALGVIAFQLLSGTVPFSGSNPLEVALQRIQRPIPSLREVAFDVPTALDVVVQRALEQDPARRFQSAGAFARAFERVLTVLGKATIASTAVPETLFDPQITQPPTVNWLEGSGINASEKNAALSSQTDTGSWQLMPPVRTGKFAAVSASSPLDTPVEDDVASIDPFVWWSTKEMSSVQAGQTPGTFTQKKTASLSARRKSAIQSRRRVIALLAGGGVVAAGVLGVTGVSLAHLLHKAAPAALGGQQAATQGNTKTGTTQPTQGNSKGSMQTTATATNGHAATPTTGPKATPTPQPQATPTSATGAQAPPTPGTQATPTPQPKPTQPPTPTPPPQHTGTVIGSTNQGTNTAQGFTNPSDGHGSLLIHLPNGNFVAYESACTHEGVTVTYDAGKHQLFCPRHSAYFDPANGGSVVSGPPPAPLRSVAIRVNADGTITTG